MTTPTPMPLQEIGSRAEFRAAVHTALDAALAREARELLWVDPDFADWPLDEPGLVETLAGWLKRPLRRLVLLSVQYDAMSRRHPRFTRWRADWAHAIDARVPAEGDVAELPTLLLDDGPTVLQLLDRDRMRGRALQDASMARTARDDIDAVLQRSGPGWPVRPLGL